MFTHSSTSIISFGILERPLKKKKKKAQLQRNSNFTSVNLHQDICFARVTCLIVGAEVSMNLDCLSQPGIKIRRLSMPVWVIWQLNKTSLNASVNTQTKDALKMGLIAHILLGWRVFFPSSIIKKRCVPTTVSPLRTTKTLITV